MIVMTPVLTEHRAHPERRRGAMYQRIADDLLDRISAGEFVPGGRLPTEQQLIGHYEASSTTVRAALKALASAGIVETRHGAGTFVVDRQLLSINATHTEDLDRREGITAQDSWSTDVLAAGRSPRQRFECGIVPATAELAELLGVDVGDALTMRRCWRSIDGTPASVETSLFPRWLVEKLPRLGEPHDISQGTTSYVAEQGHPMTFHQDHLSARPFTREEAVFFEAPPGVAGLIRTRVSYDEPGGRVLRYTPTVYRSDLHEVVYDVAGRGNRQHT
jgi:GntR family transcriptional regulator